MAGIAVSASLVAFAGPAETAADLGIGLRISFLPVVAGVAFLLADPQRPLTRGLPGGAWRTPALRMLLALPVLGLTGGVQLVGAGRALAADLRSAGQPAAALPWPALATELAAWCLIALTLAAGLERTRWHDVAGVSAALAAMAAVGVAALLPWHPVAAVIVGMTDSEHRQWTAAWWSWAGVGLAATAGACWAIADPWRRIRLGRRQAGIISWPSGVTQTVPVPHAGHRSARRRL